MTHVSTHHRAPDRAACTRSGPLLGMVTPGEHGSFHGVCPLGVTRDPDIPLETTPPKGLSPHFRAQPMHFLALELAARAGELDAGTLAGALGQDPAAPTASAFRTVARETLDRMTAAGLLTRRGRAPAFFWTLP